MAGEFVIETDKPPQEVAEFLAANAPRRIDVAFSNGLRASDFGTTEPFTKYPLAKILTFQEHIPVEALRGRVLDVGHNIGYNSIYLNKTFSASVVGIDFNPKHQKVASWLAKAAGADVIFQRADAQTFCEPASFTAVLHLGTLYHLQNPVLAIETAVKNLQTDGWLALETIAYIGEGAEKGLNKFIYGFVGDKTNWWALSKATIESLLSIYKMHSIRLVREVHLPVYKGEMSRVVYVARCARAA
jgi:SAM-dependent methyltransferase